jgi:hypothetical protein
MLPDGSDDGSDDYQEMITLLDGSSAIVSSRLRPMLMEWDWTTDPSSGAVVRTEDQLPLFEEHIRLAMRVDADVAHPMIHRGWIRTQFNALPSYKSMLALVMRQQDFVMQEYGIALPPASDLLCDAMYSALAAYYTWCSRGERWVFTEDPEKLTPGTLEKAEGPLPTYETLGAFLSAEYSGSWMASSRSATGLRPVTFIKLLERALLLCWRARVEDLNEDSVQFRSVEADLKDADLSVWMLIRYVIRTIRTYRPQN